MIYLGPFYPTARLHPSVMFVKLWKDPRFCILSADGTEELDKLAKSLGVARAGRVVVSQGEEVPEFIDKRPGKSDTLYIVNPKQARQAIIAGTTVVDAEGNFSAQHSSAPSSLTRVDNRKKCIEITETADGPVQCDQDAVRGGVTCRLHSGGTTAIGGRLYTSPRYRGFLPEKLADLYEEALKRPDLLEMQSHIAVLDAKMQSVFSEMGSLNVPSWEHLRIEIERLNDPELGPSAKANLLEYAKNGTDYDSKWNQVHVIMEQQRKLVDTEVRRQKELNLMIPVDRVMVLMASVGDIIKRHVQDPIMLAKIKREMGMLMHATAGQKGNGEIVEMV